MPPKIYGIDTPPDEWEPDPLTPEARREATRIAFSRMPRRARIAIILFQRGFQQDRIARRLRMPKWRVRRFLLRAIREIMRASDEAEGLP